MTHLICDHMSFPVLASMLSLHEVFRKGGSFAEHELCDSLEDRFTNMTPDRYTLRSHFIES